MKKAEKLRAAYKVFNWNLNFSGVSVLLLIFFLGGFIFSSLDSRSNRIAQGMSGFSLFLVGLSMQVERTTDKVIDDLIEISTTEKIGD